MASKVRDILLAAVASGALLISGTQLALARGGGGGGGHFGGGHGGGGHFGGAHFGGGHFGGSHFGGGGHPHVGNAHVRGGARISHGNFGHVTAHNFNGGRVGARSNFANGNFAHGSAAHAFAARGSGAFAGKAAWNQWGNPNWQHGWNGGWSGWNGGWGGWYAGWGGWAGPVFWPYFFGNLLAFTFWPYPYFDPFWAYGDWFVWDALFWPGPYYGPAYAYGPNYYDVYGGGYAYGNRRTRTAYHSPREVTGSVSSQTDLAQSCGGLAPGVTDLPLQGIETTLHLTGDQLKALDELKAASSQASDLLKTTCSNEVPLTPVDRLDAVQKRIDSMKLALALVGTSLDNFHNSLNDEQRQRFAALSPARAEQRRASASNNDLAALCSRRSEGFTQLPAQKVEQIVKPTQQQLDAFEKLKSASLDAANQLHASCPSQLPQTPIDRFDAVSRRLNAMSEAIKTVRPALADFYGSLSDEQKARFNTLGPPSTSRQG